MPGTAAPATPVAGTGRPAARRLTLTARAKRDRRKPYAFAVSGRLTPARGARCTRATVAIQLRAGRRLAGSATARLGKDCRFKATIRTKRAGKLKATARFLGTPAMTGVSSKPLTLRAG